MSVIARILLLATCCLFLGRGYEYFFWGSPIRVLVWDEVLFGPVVENIFGRAWDDFVSDLAVDRTLSLITQAIAVYFWCCAVAAVLYYRTQRRIWAWIIGLGGGLVLLHALLETKDHFYHVAQFFEYAIQVSLPFLLIGSIRNDGGPERLLRVAKIVIACTFVAHGLYAIGAYPVPGNFVDMTIGLLGASEATARNFLVTVGILDLIAAVLLFVPAWQKAGLYYTIFWGSITALARVAYGFDVTFPTESLHGSLYRTVYRLPHGLVPLAAMSLVNHLVKTRRPPESDGEPPAEFPPD